MRTTSERLSCLLLFVSLACLLMAGFVYVRPPGSEAGLVVERPSRVVEGLAPGREYDIEFRIHNRTGRTLRVVGGPCFT